MDETLALPTEKAAKIALRTQQLIACETGVTNSIDPLAGSYLVESLTRRMEEGAEEYFRKIESLGGVVRALEKGFLQMEISRAAYRFQQAIEKKERIVVGVNEYIDPDESLEIDLLKIDPEVEESQIRRLKALKERRDNDGVRRALESLRAAARSTDNLMPRILDCVRLYATEGEIVDVLREEFGEYHDPKFF
jgi:methylmalonyl-CoA mutase N-terminal domain/subunit